MEAYEKLKGGWVGVRPIRSRDEIYSSVELVVRKSTRISVEDFRECILSVRLQREDRRLKATQRAISLESNLRTRAVLLTKAEQLIRILRATGLLVREGKTYSSTRVCKKLHSLKQENEVSADCMFLELLLKSRYHTYWLYLKRLIDVGQVYIPRRLPKRNRELRNYVNSKGFLVDAWSFFIMRDLFYEFSLINFIEDESGQIIFPLCARQEQIPSGKVKFKHSIRVQDGKLFFWPQLELKVFIDRLVEIYLELSDNSWNRMSDLIRLRERFSKKYRVPERLFDRLLQESFKRPSNYDIILSFGPIEIAPGSAYAIKALSLPYNQFGLPYSLVRINSR